MASLGVLASLMQGLTPTMPQYNPMEEAQQQALLQGRRSGNETALIQLADLKQKQAAEQEMFAAIQQNPALAQQFFGAGPVLGSLQTAPGGAGAAPMTQTTTIPGQPPGAPQVVTGGQNLSQFATQGAPQSILASLGPQPQGPMQAPRNPVLEMAQRDPQAAFLMQQQLQAQQLNQLTMQEKHLDMGVKVSEAIARQLQGVTDQASLEEARERVRLIHPQAAAQIPQFYSKEGVEAIQQRGIAMSEQAKNRHLDAQSRLLDVKSEHLPRLYGRIGEEDTAVPAGQPGSANGAAPPASRPAGRGGQAPQESEHTRLIRAEAIRQDVDPDLAVAVATQESYLNPNASGDGGKSLGYFQLQEGAAKDVGIDPAKRGDPALNIQGGVAYLKRKLAQAGGNVDKALQFYNGGGDPNYVANVRRFLPGGGSATGTSEAPPTDPRIAQLEAKIAKRTRDAQLAAGIGEEALATQLSNDANRLTEERKRLIEEGRRQQERREEIPRAADKVRAEEQARYGEKQRQQAGPLLPEQEREFFTKLRSDVRAEPTHRTYQEIRNGYQNVRVGAQSDSAQGDLAIFNGLAKILDPTGSVLSGEARNVEDAQGQLQVWFNSPQKFFEGDRLTPENRQRFLKMAHALAKEKLTTAQTELKTVYGPLAKKAGIDFEQLVPLPDLKPLEPGPNAKKFDQLFDEK